MANELADFLASIPVVTRWWFTTSLVLPLLGRFGLISAQWMYLNWELFAYNFHFWRPVTALIFYPVSPQTGFHWLLMLYFLYNYSKNLEQHSFAGKTADYLWLIILSWISCVVLGFALGMYFLLEPMVLAVLYIWCQINKDQIVSFWFGMRFKAAYLPWVLVAFNAVLRGSAMNELVGILVGHIYVFANITYPANQGLAPLLPTPAFLERLLPTERGGYTGMFGRQPGAAAGQPAPDFHPAFQGRGRQLGDN